jgi:hypothetical protein
MFWEEKGKKEIANFFNLPQNWEKKESLVGDTDHKPS